MIFFEIMHINLWGPYSVRSIIGVAYTLTIVEDFLRATWTFLLKDKTIIHQILEDFFKMV